MKHPVTRHWVVSGVEVDDVDTASPRTFDAISRRSPGIKLALDYFSVSFNVPEYIPMSMLTHEL